MDNKKSVEMKKIIVLMAVLVLVIGASVAEERMFPLFTLDDLSGNRIELNSLLNKDKPIIITFWATWCKPCKRELRKLYEYWENWDTTKGERQYIIIALCEDGPRSKRQALALAKKEGWDNFIIPYDDGQKIKKKAGVADIPELFILKPDGTIFYRHIGFNPGDEKKTIAKLEELIEKIGKTKENIIPEEKSDK